MTDEGWFADLSDEEDRDPTFPWQPFLQTGSCCFPLPVRFASEAECMDFIREDIVGRGVLDSS